MTKLRCTANIALLGITFLLTSTAGTAQTARQPAQRADPSTNKPTRTRRAESSLKSPESGSASINSKPSKVTEAGSPVLAAEKPNSVVVEQSPETPKTIITQHEQDTAAAATSETTVPSDPIAALREEITAATDSAEKAQLQMRLVEMLTASGDTDEALSELRLMSGTDQFNPQGFYNVGNAMARLGDAEGAVAVYRKAIGQRKGRYSKALNNLAVVLMRQGRWDEAYDSLTNALRLENFRYAEASYNLGRLFAFQGEHDLAIREWSRALAVNSEHSGAAQALAAARSEGRISVLSRGKSTASEVPLSHDETRITATRASRTTPVGGVNNKLTIDPETYSFLQKARNARERHRNEEAITNYRRVITRMGGYFAPANLELGYVLINAKRVEEGLLTLLPLTERDGPSYPISYYYVARLYEARGELKLAEENFTRAATLYRQDNAQFLLDISRVREKLGDYRGALAVLEEYLATAQSGNVRLDGAEQRLAFLKQKVASAQPK